MRDAIYRLVVRGELDARFAYFFDDMALSAVEGTTVITGRVRDESQLYGLIERLAEMGLELLLVQQLNATDIRGERQEGSGHE